LSPLLSLGCRTQIASYSSGRGTSLAELGAVWRYSYWSDQKVRDLAADNAIDLDRRWRTALRTPTFGFLPQGEATRERGALQRHEIATKLEAAIGQVAVADFVTPPPSRYAKGVGEVTFSIYSRWGEWSKKKKKTWGKGVIVHTRAVASNGCRVEFCLFGSIENCAGYMSAPKGSDPPLWRSSSTWAIEEYIQNLGLKLPAEYADDDDQSIAVEILRTLNNEGMTGRHVSRRIESAEWFAQVYKDVELDKERWNLRPGEDIPRPVDRIVIGMPIWVRSRTGSLS
jgi:hypothetical protein